MTYGQPQQPGQYPYQQPVQAASNSRATLLTAPTALHAEKLFQAGIGVAVAGAVLLIFSCLAWLSDTDNTDATLTVSGLGSASIEGESSTTTSAVEELTSAPGGWTLAFGLLLLIAGGALISRKFQPIAAAASAAFGFAAFVCAVVFFADPVGALIDFPNAEADESTERGYGLWLVFVFGIVALGVGVYALVLVLFPEKFRPTQKDLAAAQGMSAPFGQPQQFGQAQQYGQPQQFGQAQQYGQPQQFGQAQQNGQPQQYGHAQQYGAQAQYGQPQYGQAQYGQPGAGAQPQQYGQQQHGQQQYGAAPAQDGAAFDETQLGAARQQYPGEQYPGYGQPPQH